MAGAMRKMAVYLGLVEDEGRYDKYDEYDEYEDYDGDSADSHDRSRPAERDERPERPERAAVTPISGRTSERVVERTPERAVERPDRAAERGSERPADRPTGGGSTALRGLTPVTPRIAGSADGPRITTLHPRTYNEARQIGEHFRDGVPVIMNLTEMDDTDAKRLVDFAAGLIFGLHGSIERITNKVFLLSPADVTVAAEDKARIAENGFFNQS